MTMTENTHEPRHAAPVEHPVDDPTGAGHGTELGADDHSKFPDVLDDGHTAQVVEGDELTAPGGHVGDVLDDGETARDVEGVGLGGRTTAHGPVGEVLDEGETAREVEGEPYPDGRAVP
ncbi:hypothetical protein [Cellulomonas massiliensis]|uniref:hypothetical protein n=1 Tax=Cellulomonas massiliensis TaxID=1465811 RepID=UPI0011CA605D|nr:hypothetical protein [Cellulomonas massiliensis]